MKVAIYADLHIHNHHKKVINSETALNFLDFLKEYCVDHDIKEVYSAGDFFHTKSRAYAPHVIQSLLKIKEIYKAGIKQYMLIGNHDMANPVNTMNSILFTFSDYATIIPDYKFVDYENTRVHFLSYSNTLFNQFILSKSKKNILIAHLDIIGFQMTSGIKCHEGCNMDLLGQFDYVLSGHYHLHQRLKNILYIGNCFQTNFGEANQKKGFIVFDIDSFEYEFVEYEDAPKYFVYEINNKKDIKKIPTENNFLRIKLTSPNIDHTKLRQELYDKSALSVDVLLYDDVKEIENFTTVLDDSPTQLVSSFLNDSSIPEDISRDEAMIYFKKIEEYSNNITDETDIY